MLERLFNRGLPGFLMACLFLSGGKLHAEAESQAQVLSFHVWNHENGLPSDTVTSLLQTHDGYLWVGTDQGLARFDGSEFDSVSLTGDKTNQLAVTSLCEDETHRLWVGTKNGGLLWEQDGIIHSFNGGRGTGKRSITSLAADNSNLLWVGTTEGLYRVDLGTLNIAAPSLGFSNDSISSVHAARSGTIWITTRNGMSQYKNGRVTAVELDAENLGRTLEFIGLYEDRGGSLWAFGDTYLVNLSEGKRFNYFRTGDASSFRIWTLCESSSGQLWIGTSGQGLFAFSDGKFRPLALRENRLPSDVRAICEDRQGDLWLGTFGGGLIRLRVRQDQVFDSHAGLPEETASCIAVDSAGKLWAGFQKYGLYAETGRRFATVGNERLIQSLCLGPDGNPWIGTRGNGLFRITGSQEIHIDTGNGLSSDNITALASQPDGSVFIGTGAGKVHRLRGNRLETFDEHEGLSGETITALYVNKNENVYAGTSAGEIFSRAGPVFQKEAAEGIKGAPICAMQESADGGIWIGTAGKGLACLEKNHTSVWNINNGLPDNDVFGVLPEDKGVVWVATGKGIFRLANCAPGSSTNSVVAQLVLESEPRGHDIIGYPTAAKSDDGRFWFAVPGQIFSIDPRKVTFDSSPCPVCIEKLLANDSPLPITPGGQPIRLPPQLSSVEIRFAALNLAEPEKVQFQHKLDGFDSGWIDGGGERRVRYGRLPFGNYVFHIRAKNENGTWTESDSPLALYYPVPAWRSPGALALYVAAGVGFVVLLVWAITHHRLQLKLEGLARQQAMDKERMRIAQDMHDEIGSKLSKIAYLSDIMSLRNGSETESLQSIAGTSRDLLQSLDEIVWAVNPRNDSLERLTAYLGHYATEYFQDTPVDLEMDLPAGLPERSLSAETRHNLFLAFEEALANALKHSGANQVRVSMALARNRFIISIDDNGKGFEPGTKSSRTGGGNGLTNMEQRLRDIGGTCQINSKAGAGTTVCLSFDIIAAKPKYA